jgi:short-subunit dehydrogenase
MLSPTLPIGKYPHLLLERALRFRDTALSAALTGGNNVGTVPPNRRVQVSFALRRALRDRYVLVSGASSGIGRAVALKAANAGATVVLVARSESKLVELQAEIARAGGRALVYAADLSKRSSADALLATLAADGVHIDVLVNNAGRSIRRSVRESCDRFHDFERTMSLNYFGSLRLVLGLLPGMQRSGGGHVINVSTAGVQMSTPLFAAYIASKAALDAFTRVAAAETEKDGVRFTTVNMPLVRTPMIAPTEAFDHLPCLTPDEAADLVLRAVVTRETQLGTPVARLFDVGHALAPGAVRRFLGYCYRVLSRNDVSSVAVELPEPHLHRTAAATLTAQRPTGTM